MREKYIAPSFNEDAFHCPHCEVYAHQRWYTDHVVGYSSHTRTGFPADHLSISVCERCGKYALWFDAKMLYPISSIAPLPVEDMPEDVKEDFLEARDVVNVSARSAAALLRLALQKLMPHLGEAGKDLNEDIANLVKKGLPEKIQKSLDTVRVIGNNAVHPGKVDLKDDKETAISLFELLNMIEHVMITQPKEVEDIYRKIPDSTKKAIEERDKKE